jgi:hypothetical protein
MHAVLKTARFHVWAGVLLGDIFELWWWMVYLIVVTAPYGLVFIPSAVLHPDERRRRTEVSRERLNEEMHPVSELVSREIGAASTPAAVELSFATNPLCTVTHPSLHPPHPPHSNPAGHDVCNLHAAAAQRESSPPRAYFPWLVWRDVTAGERTGRLYGGGNWRQVWDAPSQHERTVGCCHQMLVIALT